MKALSWRPCFCISVKATAQLHKQWPTARFHAAVLFCGPNTLSSVSPWNPYFAPLWTPLWRGTYPQKWRPRSGGTGSSFHLGSPSGTAPQMPASPSHGLHLQFPPLTHSAASGTWILVTPFPTINGDSTHAGGWVSTSRLLVGPMLVWVAPCRRTSLETTRSVANLWVFIADITLFGMPSHLYALAQV